ncbi:hypothetical protein ACOAJ8_00640 [Arcobacter cryaerophilus gv. pseudocryaerophilus]
MQIESKIIGIINDKLKNPIYETLRLLNMKTILTKSNFSKKEGVAVHMVVLHFVYMLVMNKKISTFMDQSNDSFKKMSITDYLLMLTTTGENYYHLVL